MRAFFYTSALATAVLALAACSSKAPPEPTGPKVAVVTPVAPQPVVVGGDRDANGCIGSAGYLWCGHTQQCERPWELASAKGFANTSAGFKAFCEQAPLKPVTKP
jgi:hypothetical protein